MSESPHSSRDWAVIVLAGDRGPTDPVARATGAPCKVMAPVSGRPLLARVLDVVTTAPQFGAIRLVGPAPRLIDDNPALAAVIERYPQAKYLTPGASPVASAMAALATIEESRPVLITTADHALLSQSMLAAMCRIPPALDLGVGMIERRRVHDAFPDSRRTAIRLGGDGYCGCNLFALYQPPARRLVERWRRVENERKHPARVVAGMLGWGALVRYALGRLTLAGAFARLSARHGVRVGAVLLDEPRAAVDVDSVADLRQVERILNADQEGSASDIAPIR